MTLQVQQSGAYLCSVPSYGDPLCQYPTSKDLGAVFVNSSGAKLFPGSGGNQLPIFTFPTLNGGIPTDIPEDFTIPEGYAISVTIPAGAVALLFTPNDSYFSDNSDAGGNYGAYITPPPLPPPPAPPLAQLASPPKIPAPESCSLKANSTVDVDQLILNEQIPVTGVGFSLVYESDRVEGRREDFKLRIPLLTSDTTSIQSVALKVEVAGQTFTQNFSPSANLSFDYTWNGKDSNGQKLTSSSLARLTITTKMSDGATYPNSYSVPMGHFEASGLKLGGWTLSQQHFYDPLKNRLHLGTGGDRPVLATVRDGLLYVPSLDASEVYVFSAAGLHLKTLRGVNGAILLSFNYDASNVLISIVDAFANTTTFNSSSTLVTITSPYNHVTTLTLNADGWLAKVENPSGERHQLTYQSGGLLTNFEKPNGQRTTVSYNTIGHVLKDIGAGGDFLELVRTSNGVSSLTTSKTALNRMSTYATSILSDGVARNVGSASGETTSLIMKTLGSSRSESSTGVIVSSTTTPDVRFGSSATFTSSFSTSIAQTGFQSTSQSTQAVTLSDPADPFSVSNLQTQTTVDGARTFTEVYDSSSRTMTSTSPMGRTMKLTTSEVGLPTQITAANFTPTTFSYDTRGRLLTKQNGARMTSFAYTSRNEILSETDALGRVSEFSYDLSGRRLTEKKPDGRIVGFSYDANGNMTSLVTPSGNLHAFEFNLFDLNSKYLSPDLGPAWSRSTLYTYNLDRQLTEVRRPSGASLLYSYDSAKGLLKTIKSGSNVYTYSYDPAARLTQLNSPDGVVLANSYNGNLLTKVQAIGTAAGEITFGYSNDFDLSSVQVGTNTPVSYFYDADKLLTQVGSQALTRNLTTGLLTTTTLDTNAIDAYTYDAGFGELSSHQGRYQAANRFFEAYSRDALGRIERKAVIEAPAVQQTNYAYYYDPSGRLTSVYVGPVMTWRYTYDANSNRTSAMASGVTTTATYDEQDRLQTYGTKVYGYNLNGDVSSVYDSSNDEVRNYQWDAFGNLKRAMLPHDVTVYYKYDALNRRVTKLNSQQQVIERYVYLDQTKLAAVLDANGATLITYAWGDRSSPEYMTKNGVNYKLMTDSIGSVRQVMNTATGEIVQRISYDPFGQMLSNSNPSFQLIGFAGGLYDKDTGLTQFGARWYDAEVGRWLSKDPILFAGGDTNLYGYTFNDPINRIDPTGHNSWIFGENFSDMIRQINTLISDSTGMQTNMSSRKRDQNTCSVASANDGTAARDAQIQNRINTNAAQIKNLMALPLTNPYEFFFQRNFVNDGAGRPYY